jgi:ubiquinone/menaquinone biosynthesis C-methylase UbiE
MIEGITMVPFEVSRARELAKKHNVSNMVNYSVMDYSNTKFSEKSFDAIYTTESLVHSPDVKKTLREFYRILKKGGRIAMFETSIAEDTKLTEYERYIVEKVIFSVALAGQKQIRNDRFVQVMKRIGFKNIRSENLTENVAPSVQRLVRFFTIPYFFVKLLNLQSQFPNLTGVLEFAKLGVKGLFRYNAFTAKK